MKKITIDKNNKEYKANWEFATDKIMSPKGIDITPFETMEWRAKEPKDKKDLKKYREQLHKWFQDELVELTKYNEEKHNATVYIGRRSEIEILIKEL